MNTFNTMMRAYPPDRFPEKATAITKATEKFALDEFYYSNFDNARPTFNKLSKLCAEYINMAMSHIIGLKFTATKVALVIDDLTGVLRPGISACEIYAVDCVISNDNKNHRIKLFSDGSVYSNSHKTQKFYTPEIKESFANCITHLNGILERGCLHACIELQESGLWYTDRNMYECIVAWLRSTNPSDDNINEEALIKTINDTILSEINSELTMECRLEKTGGDNESIPAFTPVIISDGTLASVFLPQRISKGWGISVVTNEDNLKGQHLADINQMTIGINKLITTVKKTRV